MKKLLFYPMMLTIVLIITACGNQQQRSNQAASEILATNISISNEVKNITDRHWKLVELMGNPIDASTSAFIFMNPDGTVHGNLGCNSFSGSFTQQEGNRINFSQLAQTQKFCLEGMEIEAEMARVLQQADNYNLTETQLVLNRARMAPLARFEEISEN